MIGFTYADGSAVKAGQFIKKLFNNGVISFTAGDQPTRVRFLMPVGVVTIRDIDEVSKIIKQTLIELN